MNNGKIQFRVFIGHVFQQEQFDDLRGALDAAFSEVDLLEIIYADTARFHGALFPKIQGLIDSSLFCIFEVSEQNTNVFLEFGYALGRGKLCIPIVADQRNRTTQRRGNAGIQKKFVLPGKPVSTEQVVGEVIGNGGLKAED